jgi:hypothetical protein
MMNRKERRAEARRYGLDFQPEYNGQGPVTHLEYHGVGYERFDTKYNVVSTKTTNTKGE